MHTYDSRRHVERVKTIYALGKVQQIKQTGGCEELAKAVMQSEILSQYHGNSMR